MRSVSFAESQTLPASLPPAAAFLYGFVDATQDGHNRIRYGATTATLASAIYRGDGIAAALTTAGLATTFANGLFTCTPPSPNTLRAFDRLGVLMGLFHSASTASTPSATSHTSERISPVAIPLAGFTVARQVIQADDELNPDRFNRDMGHVYGAARVLEVRAMMHKWSLDAVRFGWVMRGKVAFVGPDVNPLDGATPGGSITGRVIGVSEPTFIGAAQLWAEVAFTIAIEEPS
jgi:hypothetical protein